MDVSKRWPPPLQPSEQSGQSVVPPGGAKSTPGKVVVPDNIKKLFPSGTANNPNPSGVAPPREVAVPKAPPRPAIAGATPPPRAAVAGATPPAVAPAPPRQPHLPARPLTQKGAEPAESVTSSSSPKPGEQQPVAEQRKSPPPRPPHPAVAGPTPPPRPSTGSVPGSKPPPRPSVDPAQAKKNLMMKEMQTDKEELEKLRNTRKKIIAEMPEESMGVNAVKESPALKQVNQSIQTVEARLKSHRTNLGISEENLGFTSTAPGLKPIPLTEKQKMQKELDDYRIDLALLQAEIAELETSKGHAEFLSQKTFVGQGVIVDENKKSPADLENLEKMYQQQLEHLRSLIQNKEFFVDLSLKEAKEKGIDIK